MKSILATLEKFKFIRQYQCGFSDLLLTIFFKSKVAGHMGM